MNSELNNNDDILPNKKIKMTIAGVEIKAVKKWHFHTFKNQEECDNAMAEIDKMYREKELLNIPSNNTI